MFGPSLTLFRIFGFAVRVDVSWIVIAVLVTWSLAVGVFPDRSPGLGPGAYWTMGALGALGLFASIVLHELGHALMARRRGVEMRGITLFIFGGVAEMTEEPRDAESELLIAIAGPLVSIALALLFFGASLAPIGGDGWAPVAAVLQYLGLINGVLVLFNMIPAFPLDGGRVLRSILWSWKGNVRWATKISSRFGAAFGYALMALGLVSLLMGNLLGAVWWFVLGMFLRNAAQMSYQQLLVRRALAGEPVSRFMKRDPVAAPANITLGELVRGYMYQHHFKMFPVVENGRLVGCVSTQQVKDTPREEWETRTVAEVVRPCTAENTVGPGEDAMRALSKMSRGNLSRLVVVDHGEVVGVLTLKDLLAFLSMKVELEGE